MMKFLAVLFITLQLCNNCVASPQPRYPKYESVIKKFFGLYAPPEVFYAGLIEFAKKQDGWHVITSNYDTETKKLSVKNDFLFWSSKRNKFEELDVTKAETWNEEKNIESQLLSDWMVALHYNCNPYYGYDGWGMDVVDLLKGETNLNDTLLYALAQAYNETAQNFIYLSFSHAENRAIHHNVTEARIDSFIKYSNRGIAEDIELEKKYPNFNTAIGRTKTQHGNDCTDVYMKLMMMKHPEAARKFIPDGLYAPAMVDIAKDYLASCAPGAILFTQGDNDTYPLLYVQGAYAYRPDVHIINLSLIGAQEWIDYHIKSDTSLGIIPPVLYSNNNDDVIQILEEDEQGAKNKASDTIDIHTFFHSLFDQNQDGKIDSNDVKEPKIYSHFVSLPVSRKAALSIVEKEDAKNIRSKIIFNFHHNYLLKPDWVMMHIIAHCITTRPIYFAYSVSPEAHLGTSNYLQQEGLAYRLVPAWKESAADGYPEVQKDIFYNNFMNHFSTAHLSDDIFSNESDEYRMINNLRPTIVKLAIALLNANQKDKAVAVINKLDEAVREKEIPIDFPSVSEDEIYYKLDMLEKASALANKLLDMYAASLQTYTSMQGEELQAHQRNINEGVFVLNQVQEISTEKDKPVFHRAYELFNKYKAYYNSGKKEEE